MNQMYGQENETGVREVTNTALDYNLLSKYTAFVAVDEIPVEAKQDNVPTPANKPSTDNPNPRGLHGLHNPIFGESQNRKYLSQSLPNQSRTASLNPTSVNDPNNATPSASNNNQSVPEPSEIIGNLLALICLVLFFTRKRWHHLLKALLQPKM